MGEDEYVAPQRLRVTRFSIKASSTYEEPEEDMDELPDFRPMSASVRDLNLNRKHSIRKSIFQAEKIFRTDASLHKVSSFDAFFGIIASVLLFRSANVLVDLNFSTLAIGRFFLTFFTMWMVWLQAFVSLETCYIQVSLIHLFLKGVRIVLLYGMSLCIPSLFNTVGNTLTNFMLFLAISKGSVVIYTIGILFVDRRFAYLQSLRLLCITFSVIPYLVVMLVSPAIKEWVWMGAVVWDNLSTIALFTYEKLAKVSSPFTSSQTIMKHHMVSMSQYLIAISIFNLFRLRIGVDDSPYSVGYTYMSYITGFLCVLVMIAIEMVYSSSLNPEAKPMKQPLRKYIFEMINCFIQAVIVCLGASLANLMHAVNLVFDKFGVFVDLPPSGFLYTPNVIVRMADTNIVISNKFMETLPNPTENINPALLPSYPEALSMITVVTDSSSSLTVATNPSVKTVFTSCILALYVACTILAVLQTRYQWEKWIVWRGFCMIGFGVLGFLPIHIAFSFFGQASLFAIVCMVEYHRRIFIENLYEE